MLRWHLQEGRSAIPKSVDPGRIAANFDVTDFVLTDRELELIDALDTGVRGGPEPDAITLETHGRPVPRPDRPRTPPETRRSAMHTRALGQGLEVSAVGLGPWGCHSPTGPTPAPAPT
nr:hypothetical protein [Tessaracoccus coleopterorum]